MASATPPELAAVTADKAAKALAKVVRRRQQNCINSRRSRNNRTETLNRVSEISNTFLTDMHNRPAPDMMSSVELQTRLEAALSAMHAISGVVACLKLGSTARVKKPPASMPPTLVALESLVSPAAAGHMSIDDELRYFVPATVSMAAATATTTPTVVTEEMLDEYPELLASLGCDDAASCPPPLPTLPPSPPRATPRFHVYNAGRKKMPM